MKDFLNKIISSKEAQVQELRQSIKDATDVNEVRALGETLEKVLAELQEAKDALAALNAEEVKSEEKSDETEGRSTTVITNGRTSGFNPIATFGKVEERGGNEMNELEARAQKFAETHKMSIDTTEQRAVLVSSGQIATATGVAGINEGFNTVSSIIDQVNVENCQGMGEFKVAYEVSGLTANKTKEGDAIATSDPVYAYATIKPTNISVLTYLSNQVLKQTPLQYEAKVKAAALKALRAKVAALVIAGDAEAGFGGIVSSEIAKKLENVVYDEKFLRKVALTYGGNEAIVQSARLYINKEDLIVLGDVRGTDKKTAVYDIIPDAGNPNTGVIKDGGLTVPYTINSTLPAGTSVYGQPLNYTLGLFGNYEIKVSEDAKDAFEKNQIAIRGTVDLGGSVCFKDGFIVATKAA